MAEATVTKSIGDLAKSVIDSVEGETDLQRRLAEGPSIPCGLRDVDLCLRGLWPGDLAVLASAPTVGRSTFAFQVALNAALAGACVGLFSLELDAEAVAMRMVSSSARIFMNKIIGGYVTDKELAALADTQSEFAKLSLSVYDDSHISLEGLCDIAKGSNISAEKHLVVVDGVEQIADVESIGLSGVAKRLRLLAQEIEAPVLMTVCLPGKEARGVRRGKCWAGAILDLMPDVAVVADVVLMLDRSLDELEAEGMFGAPPLNVVELSIAKSRRSWQRSITLGYVPEYMRFMDYTSDSYL